MTFDNGVSTANSTVQEVSEQMIRLIIQAIMTLAVLGGWLWSVVNRPDITPALQAPLYAVVGFWFGQGIVGTWAGVQHNKAAATVEAVRIKTAAGSKDE